MLKNFVMVLSLSTCLMANAVFAMDQNKEDDSTPFTAKRFTKAEQDKPCYLEDVPDDILKPIIAYAIVNNPSSLDILQTCKKMKALGDSEQVVSHVAELIYNKGMDCYRATQEALSIQPLNTSGLGCTIGYLVQRENILGVVWWSYHADENKLPHEGLNLEKLSFVETFKQKNSHVKYTEIDKSGFFAALKSIPLFSKIHLKGQEKFSGTLQCDFYKPVEKIFSSLKTFIDLTTKLEDLKIF